MVNKTNNHALQEKIGEGEKHDLTDNTGKQRFGDKLFNIIGKKPEDVLTEFTGSINDNRDSIMSYYPNLTSHEYDEIAKRAIGILYQETRAGDSLKYKLKEMLHLTHVTSLFSDTWSRGYTQLKYNGGPLNQEDKQLLTQFNINDENDLTNTRNCGIATMIGLIRNYYDMIIPMKSDSFRRNDAEIIRVTFNKEYHGKNIQEDFARGKVLPKIKRARTEEELRNEINKWGEKYGGIKNEQTLIRKGITNDDDFFDFLYYSRNKPTEIAYGTAIPEENLYIKNCNSFLAKHNYIDTLCLM